MLSIFEYWRFVVRMSWASNMSGLLYNQTLTAIVHGNENHGIKLLLFCQGSLYRFNTTQTLFLIVCILTTLFSDTPSILANSAHPISEFRKNTNKIIIHAPKWSLPSMTVMAGAFFKNGSKIRRCLLMGGGEDIHCCSAHGEEGQQSAFRKPLETVALFFCGESVRMVFSFFLFRGKRRGAAPEKIPLFQNASCSEQLFVECGGVRDKRRKEVNEKYK